MSRRESHTMKSAMARLVAIALWSLTCESASAMTFDVVAMKGEPAIRGRGEIVAGDATRLKGVLTPNAKHSYGYYTLILESPGGVFRLRSSYPGSSMPTM